MRLIIEDRVPARAGTYAVHFCFHNDVIQLGGLPYEVPACSCTIHHGPCANPTRPCKTLGAVTATTWCSPKEPLFIRAQGRKQALRKALAGFPRDLRTKLWQAYHTVSPPPPPRGQMKRPRRDRMSVGRVQANRAA